MWKQLIAAASGAGILFAAEIFRELHSFRIREYEILTSHLPEGKELRMTFLSDLHNHIYGKDNGKLLKAVRDTRPDLILTGGDMLVARKAASWEVTADFMKKLPDIAPVYYVDGNHEQRMKLAPEIYGSAYADYRKELEHAGICYLENECKTVNFGSGKIQLCGMEVPQMYYKRASRPQLSMEDMIKIMGHPRSEGYRILMVHQPDFAPVYLKWGADLVLSGHLHGGIVRIPWIGAVISPQLKFFPKYSGGLYKEAGEKNVIVSQGLGTHTINLRLFNPAEVVSIRIRGKNLER